ncbi:MAG: DUF805 domain-containing protein [Cyanobacteria bacterium J06639_18]
MKWYIDALKKYGVFSGRSRRKAYWMFWLFDVIFTILFSVIDQIIGNEVEILSTLYTLATIIPSLAVAVRRIHDTGHSGWWILFPIVNLVFLCTDSQPESNKYGPNPKG